MIISLQHIECPNCGTWYSYSSLESYTVFGNQTYWSDGLWEENPSERAFLQCAKCQTIFWKREADSIPDWVRREHTDENGNFIMKAQSGGEPKKAAVLKRIKSLVEYHKKNEHLRGSDDFLFADGVFNEELANAPVLLLEHEINFLFQALDQLPMDSGDDEIYVRTLIWQKINDLLRPDLRNFHYWHIVKFWFRRPLHALRMQNDKRNERKQARKLYKKIEQKRIDNLEQLLPLSDSDAYQIEILRQMGHFLAAWRLFLQSESYPVSSFQAWRLGCKILLRNSYVFQR